MGIKGTKSKFFFISARSVTVGFSAATVRGKPSAAQSNVSGCSDNVVGMKYLKVALVATLSILICLSFAAPQEARGEAAFRYAYAKERDKVYFYEDKKASAKYKTATATTAITVITAAVIKVTFNEFSCSFTSVETVGCGTSFKG